MTSSYEDIFTDDRLDIKSNVIDFAHLIEHEDFNTTTSSNDVFRICRIWGWKNFFLYEVI